jgi:hypothetical protein
MVMTQDELSRATVTAVANAGEHFDRLLRPMLKQQDVAREELQSPRLKQSAKSDIARCLQWSGMVPMSRRARHAGIPTSLARVLTDRGNEFKADFAASCAALGIRQTRIKTRMPGPMASSSSCSKRFSPSTGARSSDATTSPAGTRWRAASTASCSFTTLIARTTAIAPAAARRPRPSTAPWRRRTNHILHSGTARV